jgi:hypothetical protein
VEKFPINACRVGVSWGRCYDFKNIFCQKIGEKNGVLIQNTAEFYKQGTITLILKMNANFYRKMVKIVEY